ncbi:MAG: 4-hydroxythreonine-4-phosphate dehydrogenase PdxA [Betaproteobacteria bacterium]
MTKSTHLVITSGEPAGIGPEVAVKAAIKFLKRHPNLKISILGDESLFDSSVFEAGRLELIHHSLTEPAVNGKLNPKNAPYVIELLDYAVSGCIKKEFHAMVTAPIHKGNINTGGIPFSGHTEYLAHKANQSLVVMMLCGTANFGLESKPSVLRVALATTHHPLIKVPQLITQDLLEKCIQIINDDLIHQFGIATPRIKVAGLNPHAGEGGYLGREEIEIIQPAIQSMQKKGIQVMGPYPADTMFDALELHQVDVFLAMYHDQGLAPFKFASFGKGVNVTLGLPFIRTSVDHGTALEISGKNMANYQSMYEALELAAHLAHH